jgi:nicotinamidase-related amidase
VPYVKEKIRSFDGKVLFTRDTHFDGYMESAEGKKLPVPHCIKGTEGWQIRKELDALRTTEPIDKITFGSKELVAYFADKAPESVTLVGLCTDICVISNAMLLKAFYPELPILADARGCAGVTPESHENALRAMQTCQIDII